MQLLTSGFASRAEREIFVGVEQIWISKKKWIDFGFRNFYFYPQLHDAFYTHTLTYYSVLVSRIKAVRAMIHCTPHAKMNFRQSVEASIVTTMLTSSFFSLDHSFSYTIDPNQHALSYTFDPGMPSWTRRQQRIFGICEYGGFILL